MKRIVITCLVGLLLAVGVNSLTKAATLNCKGYLNGAKNMSLDLSGETKTSPSSMISVAAVSQFNVCFSNSAPFQISFDGVKNIKLTTNLKAHKKLHSTTNWGKVCPSEYIMSLLDNGKLILKTKGHRGLTLERRWQCDKGRNEVAEIWSDLQEEPSTDVASSSEFSRLKAEIQALKDSLEAAPKKVEDVQPSASNGPKLSIISKTVKNRRGQFTGRVSNPEYLSELIIDGQETPFLDNGNFEWQGFVPAGGKSVVIEAIDTTGLSSMQEVRLERGQKQTSTGPTFAQLDPFRGKAAKTNRNALALIVGVSDYKSTPDPATYADKDAEYFQDYAAIKLGVPDNNIFTMINQDADRIEIKKAVKNWLLRMSEKDKTDVYVFFAGHGLTSRDGKNMFLIPYDGDPELLEDSAIDRKQLFADILDISPRSVTVFLDSCYSGGTRAGGTLVASLRPITIRTLEQNIPDGFTVLSAARGDQTSQALEEAKHGLFSYFLMRGLEGDADANNDNQITNGELHDFVTEKVERQSGFKQTPDLQGDRERVLVKFQ